MTKTVGIVVKVLGALLLTVIILILIPFLIDFSFVKPQIQKAVRENLNAEVDFESIRLSLITGPGVTIKKFKIENTDPMFKGTKLFSVNEIFFRTELFPLFQKKFIGKLAIEKPEITIAQSGLKNNISSLMKEKPKTEETKPTETEKPAEKAKEKEPTKPDDTMKLIKDSVLIKEIEISQAALRIKDFKAADKEPIKVTDFNLKIENIGLERKIPLKLWTEVSVKQPGMEVSGPINFSLVAFAKASGTGLDYATFDGGLDLDSLSINAMGAFVKPKGINLNTKFKGRATTNSLNVESFTFNLHNLALVSNINIKDFKTLETQGFLSVENNELKDLGQILPQHKNILLNGSLKIASSVNGPLSEPKKVKAKLDLNTKLTGSDLAVKYDLVSLEPLNMELSILSSKLDLGAILKPFMPPKSEEKPKDIAAEKAEKEKAKEEVKKPASPQEEKEFELTAEQKKMLAGSHIAVEVKMNEFLFDKIKIEDMYLNAKLEGLKAQLEEFRLASFGGKVKIWGAADLGAAPLDYKGDVEMKNVRTEQVIAFVAEEHKDLLVGSANLDLSVKGQGTTKPNINKNLNGQGEFQLLEGELHTASVSDQMQKEFNSFVGGLSITGEGGDIFKSMEKLANNPLAKKLGGGKFDLEKYKKSYSSFNNVGLASKGNVDKKIKDVKGKIEIKNGRIYLKDVNRKAADGDYMFAGSVGIVETDVQGDITYVGSESTNQQLLSKSKYASLLFDEKGQFNLKMLLGGTLMAPKVTLDTKEMKARFSKNARALVEKEVKKGAGDTSKGVADQAKEAAKKKMDEKKQQAKDAAKKEADKKKDEAKDKAKKGLKDKLKGGLFGQ